MYSSGLAFFKLAFLLLYVRVFPLRWLRITSWIIGSFIVAWGIALEFLFIFQCTPINSLWDMSVKGHCIEQNILFLVQSVPTIVFDIIILALPVRLVWFLNIGRTSKLALLAVFTMGGL